MASEASGYVLRDERPEDVEAIYQLTQEAFAEAPHSDGSEGAIVNALRDDGDLTLSIVADAEGQLLGHIAFSPVTIAGAEGAWFGLGPVAVKSDQQGKGVGGALIREGLARLKTQGARGCVLLGDPAYYARFGFESTGGLTFGDAPAEYVQGLAFEGRLPEGEVAYRPAFG